MKQTDRLKTDRFFLFFTTILLGLIINLPSYCKSNNNNSLGSIEGNLIIKNYHPSQYRGESQNWAIAQDFRGIIYVANLNGVFEFDGVNWRLIKLPGDAYATSIGIGKDSILYVGSHSLFGYIGSDNKGRSQFYSLMDKFPENERSFSFIWEFFPTSHGLYFYTYEKLFRYYNDTITHIDIPFSSRCFTSEDKMYVFDQTKNILNIFSANESKEEINFNRINEGRKHFIIGAFPYSNNEIMFLCLNNGFIVMPKDFNSISSSSIKTYYKPEIFSFIGKSEASCVIQLRSGDYAVGTIQSGLILLDKKANIIKIINKDGGLLSESINFIKEDRCGNLWLALENGITTISTGIPITYFDNKNHYAGNALDVIKFKGKIFMATWQGIYYLDKIRTGLYTESILKKSVNNFGRGWKFHIIKNSENIEKHLLCASSYGIFSITEANSKQIAQGNFYTVIQSEKNKDLVLGLGFGGLTLIKYDEKTDKFATVYKIPELEDFEIYHVEEGENLTFWLAHRDIGISSISFYENSDNTPENAKKINNANYSYIINHYNNNNGLPNSSMIDPFILNNEVFFKTNMGIYKFVGNNSSNNKSRFISINYLHKLFFRDVASLSIIKTDTKKNIWLQVMLNKTRERALVHLKFNEYQGMYKFYQMHFKNIKHTNINQFLIDNLNNSVWIASDDALIKFDLKEGLPKVPECKTLIRKIIINNSEIFYGGGIIKNNSKSSNYNGLFDENGISSFPYNKRNLSFDFAAPLYHDNEEIVYSTYLENFDLEWSPYNKNKTISYPNLTFGKYTFYVKARDLFGNETNESSFSFYIERPWYRTHFMYVVYVFILGVIVFFAARLTNQRLFNSKTKLEKLVKERTAELARQRQQLEIEKEKSDKLLRNILPIKVAQELKTSGTVKAQYYDVVTVVFMDFKGFSKIAQYINPFGLISELDKTFGHFDDICVKYNIEKIKTIGDAYLCAAGIPIPSLDNPFSAIFASFEVLAYLRKAEKDQWLSELRIGIHTGELIAGVIGKNKFAYDIWGETVNTAARMEASGAPMRINISGETYEHIKDYIECTYRGKLPAKHKDEYDMYFVNRIKKEYSEDENGTVPNQKFLDELKRKFQGN